MLVVISQRNFLAHNCKMGAGSNAWLLFVLNILAISSNIWNSLVNNTCSWLVSVTFFMFVFKNSICFNILTHNIMLFSNSSWWTGSIRLFMGILWNSFLVKSSCISSTSSVTDFNMSTYTSSIIKARMLLHSNMRFEISSEITAIFVFNIVWHCRLIHI